MIRKQVNWQTVPLEYPNGHTDFREALKPLYENGWEVTGQTYGGMRHNAAGVNVDFFFIHLAKYEYVDELAPPKKKAGRPKKDK
ncbi:hypothetical protein HOC67_00490 [Candidatus Peregrinibacteria bacterium]|jgi:hypothetical protein|nr:hypothetical protein [Candidatus Peregrinibacteria bacterium]MBT7350789.1 hypothetical protein [candidate division WWE3 bacterium]